MPAKDIKGFEGLYKIDEQGNVFTFKTGRGSNPVGSKLSPALNTKGYSQVRIYDGNKKGHTMRVHRFVAEAFLPNPENLPQIDHIDGDKTNNNVQNLRWVSNQMNTEKALSKVFHLVHKDGSGLFIYNLNRWCREMKLDQASLFKMKSGQRKSAHGFIHMGVVNG